MAIIKTICIVFTFLSLAVAAFTLSGCKPSSAQAKQYTCEMHPEVVQDKPGTCPKCNMKLVEKK